ncbi:MAG: ANTAR domain-containing protein [Lapillicoccus sp.]
MTVLNALRPDADDPNDRPAQLDELTELDELTKRDELAERVRNLEIALVSNRRIAAAVGVVMATHDLDYDHAFSVLRQLSQHSNQPLREIAEAVLYLRRLPDGR